MGSGPWDLLDRLAGDDGRLVGVKSLVLPELGGVLADVALPTRVCFIPTSHSTGTK